MKTSNLTKFQHFYYFSKEAGKHIQFFSLLSSNLQEENYGITALNAGSERICKLLWPAEIEIMGILSIMLLSGNYIFTDDTT
jgi:hypothetical protein